MSKILIVDDEIETLNVISTFLEIIGHYPVTTSDPRFAIALAEREHPDCVLLDVMMPGIDGFALCKQMRLNSTTKSLPIMFVTAYAPLDIEDRRLDAGADMVLMKPFGLSALSSMIEGIMVTRIPESPQQLMQDLATAQPVAAITIDNPSESPDIPPNNDNNSIENACVFRRNANTGVFSSTLRDFLANIADH